MKWISVKDELPEYKKHVLLTKNNHVFAGWRECTNEDGEKYIILHEEDYIDNEEKISHWALYPEPPKKE